MRTIGMLPLRKLLLFNKAVMMRKIQLAHAPRYLSDLFSPAHSPYKTSRRNLATPRPRLDLFKSSLPYSGVILWNSLPSNITDAPSLATFKIRLAQYLKSCAI